MTQPASGFGKRGSLGVVRWGGQESPTVPALTTKIVNQFVDLSLDLPQAVDIILVATAVVPVTGLTARFILTIGSGSTNHREIFPLAVQDEAAQTQIVIRRAVQRLQIQAEVVNTTTGPKTVQLSAMAAPLFLRCEQLR